MKEESVLPVVYITKYALTKGIWECHGFSIVEDSEGTMIGNNERYKSYYHKPDWHTDLGEAKARAEVMRAKAIVSEEKKLKKLRTMKFEVVKVKEEE